MEFALALRWLLPVGACWMLALPLVAALFPRFPDRGAALALPVALLALVVPVYWVGRLDLELGIVVAVGCLVAAAFTLVRRGVELPVRRALPAVGVFVLTFGFMLFVKGAFPWIVPGGGEKFLDFGLLNSVLRSGVPPEDPWFAGRRVRYYYGGHLLVAVLTRLSGLPPRYTFVFAHPTVFASLATSVYGLAGAIAARRDHPPRLAGLAGVFLVCLAGTLATPVRMLFGVLPSEFRHEYGRAVVGGIRRTYPDALAQATDPTQWGFWFGRYVIPDVPTVYPMWTFTNGDLRPHMLSTPFLVLAAALGAAYCWTPAEQRRRRLVLLIGALPTVAGVLALVNTWEWPVAAGVALLSVALADAGPASLLPQRVRAAVPSPTPNGVPALVVAEARRLVGGTVVALVVALGGGALVAPYLFEGLAPSRGVGLFPPRSPMVPFVLAHGLFLVPFGVYFGGRAVEALPREPRWAVVGMGVCAALAALLFVIGDAAAVAVVGPLLVVAWWLRRVDRLGYEGVLVVAGAGLVLLVEFVYAVVWPFDPAAPRWNTVYKVYHTAWVLWGTAAGVVVAGVLGRAWTVLARVDAIDSLIDGPRRLATRVGGPLSRCPRARRIVTPLISRPGEDEDTDGRVPDAAADGGRETTGQPAGGRPDDAGRLRTVAVIGAAGLIVALLAGGAVFPALAVSDRTDIYRTPLVEKVQERSLDGLAYVNGSHPDAGAAIAWLDRREDVTLVSAPGEGPPTPTYTWVNAPSSLTGHPTVAGWDHERGYRGDAAYERRVDAVETVYEGSPAAARRVLTRYDVTHLYLGPNEQARYAVRNVTRIPGVRPVFEHGNVTVYAVARNASSTSRSNSGGEG